MTPSQRSQIIVILQILNIVIALLAFPALVLKDRGWLVGLPPLLPVICVIVIALEVAPSLVRTFDHGNPVTSAQQWIAKATRQLKQWGWRQLLTQAGIIVLFITVLSVVALPVIAMHLYGAAHPDYAQKYLTQEPIFPSFIFLVTSISQKVGHLGNEAKARNSQRLLQLSRILGWSTFVVFVLSLLCDFWVPSSMT
jgi:hypothetical protein